MRGTSLGSPPAPAAVAPVGPCLPRAARGLCGDGLRPPQGYINCGAAAAATFGSGRVDAEVLRGGWGLGRAIPQPSSSPGRLELATGAITWNLFISSSDEKCLNVIFFF